MGNVQATSAAIAQHTVAQAVGPALETLKEVAKGQARGEGSDAKFFDKFEGEITELVNTLPEHVRASSTAWQNATTAIRGKHVDAYVELRGSQIKRWLSESDIDAEPTEDTVDAYRRARRVHEPAAPVSPEPKRKPTLVDKAAAIATTAVAAFGLLAAWMTARKRFIGRRMVMALVMLPWALPGTVIAINLLGAFSKPSILTAGQRIYGTIAILTLAYFVRYIPLTYRSTLASIETMDPGLEEAARSLGASRARTLWKITLPLIAPGLLSGTLLVFVTALGAFVSSILLAAQAQPISVHIYGLLRVRYELAAAYSALLMALILVTLAASSKLFKTGGVRF